MLWNKTITVRCDPGLRSVTQSSLPLYLIQKVLRRGGALDGWIISPQPEARVSNEPRRPIVPLPAPPLLIHLFCIRKLSSTVGECIGNGRKHLFAGFVWYPIWWAIRVLNLVCPAYFLTDLIIRLTIGWIACGMTCDICPRLQSSDAASTSTVPATSQRRK